ncbi:unnamed protein product [Peniophora sp. CBMAI 1063]|nr:unnamed protein product [Peniophora sp. CBMAI 1063]
MPVPSISATQQALVGQTIDNGSLRLLDILGCGGFGAVFRAIAPKSRGTSATRVFAVKVIAKKSGERGHEQMRELAYHKRVSSHPNIATLHRHFKDSTFIYVVLEAVLGGDLFTAVVDKALFFYDEGLTKKIFVQILDAVAWCHSRGVYHRDLKPENVLLSANGLHAYLTDFGLATENKFSSTFGVGSRAYMSPQVINEDMDEYDYSTPHNDIWALGCIFMNMLAGCGLWKRAVLADRSFMLFLNDPDFLHEALPITKSAGGILRRVFTMDTAKRISLAELRTAVLEIDRLYLTPEELELATEEVQEIADRAIQLRIAAMESETDYNSYIGSSRSRASFGKSQCIDGPTLVNASPSPGPPTVAPPSHPSAISKIGRPASITGATQSCLAPPSLVPALLASQCLIPNVVHSVLDSASSISSTPSTPSETTSSAPITPETHAVADAHVTSGNRSMEDLALPPSAACDGVITSAFKLDDPIPKKARQDADDFMSRILHELRE